MFNSSHFINNLKDIFIAIDSFAKKHFSSDYSNTNKIRTLNKTDQPFKYKNNLWVAYSGGLDSHVLLDLLIDLSEKNSDSFFNRQQINAIHINHGWHQNADQWTQHCAAICKSYKIYFHSIKIDAIPPPGASAEAYARQLRYQALASIMQSDDCLLTAHNQDDQAETFLLQLLRGAGIKGLAAMPTFANFHSGYHVRPLLNFSRQQLQKYAEQKKLIWINDDSNFNTKFDRNFLRHTIFPVIQQRWPKAIQTISRSASHCATADHLLANLAEMDLQNCQGRQNNQLLIDQLNLLTSERRDNVLRHWLKKLAFPLPSQKQLQHIVTDILHCNIDASPQVCWNDISIRRYKNSLYALQSTDYKSKKNNTIYSWRDLTKPLKIPTLGTIYCETKIGLGIKKKFLSGKNISIRFRQGSERLQPVGRQGSHPLKKLFQEWQVPIWLRSQIPLIFSDEELIMVVGYAVAAYAAANPDEDGVIIILQ